MNTIKNIFIAMTLSLFAITAFAHEGHDHDAPKGVVAPKGGLIKSLEQSYVEVVAKGQNLKVYFYDKDLKPQDATTYKVTAKAVKPRVKQHDSITFKASKDLLEADYDAKKVHRYTLELDIKDPKEDHADSLKFVIEPRK
ncbi:hypothetical protein [Pseudobdellovibrio exovorus]|uniref:Uncharacterized protein n=1 Tax=Pseudobdellovibrio exovorus JSS TaxID=1184267 RepID=M4V6A5_9BACT|nr:hypothetical protein [Pseudobdellovibrio exovorus]AGH94728.1 hypothetical protein A11Q_508 [Pseudobdellovibrio exovorus JSS]